MASIFAVGVPKVSTVGCLIRLCKISKNHNVAQVAFMMRLAYQEPRKKPAPFPYWKKSYNMIQQFIDPLSYRFDENTRLVVVDGLPAIGKTKFCEKLAKEFGLLYMPPPSHDQIYINQYGFDTRELDPQLPYFCRSYDLERYHQNPTDKLVAFFQLLYFLMRFEQYVNALRHILATGQGVILDRSVYSDLVFTTSMVNAGHISQDALKVLMSVRCRALPHLLKPHLMIYLDAPVELIKDKIKQRGIPYELNSKVFTTNYLSDMEKIYKEKYLKDYSRYSHLLIYDWSKEGTFEDIVDDIEALDFDNTNYAEGKLDDWVFSTISDVITYRKKYDSNLYHMYEDMYDDDSILWPRELYLTGEEEEQLERVHDNCPTEKYAPGYNILAGDKILFASDERTDFSIRRTPRDFENRSQYMS